MAKGRRTEIELLNGFVVREGEQVGIQARANERLVDIVKRVERATEIPPGDGPTLEGSSSSRPTVPRRPGAETAALAADHDFISHRIPAV